KEYPEKVLPGAGPGAPGPPDTTTQTRKRSPATNGAPALRAPIAYHGANGRQPRRLAPAKETSQSPSCAAQTAAPEANPATRRRGWPVPGVPLTRARLPAPVPSRGGLAAAIAHGGPESPGGSKPGSARPPRQKMGPPSRSRHSATPARATAGTTASAGG